MSTMGRKILLVEDDRETASYLAKGLNQEGHSVEQATNGQDGLFRATDGTFDLIILDRMLPVLDGVSVLKALRAARIDTPVLILSALASVGDRIEGLECGSDDYLVKPFSFAELLARVNALLRRREARVDPAEHRLTVGDLEIDPLSRTVKRGGKKLDLKPREYLLLEYFARNEGRVVTRTMLLEQVWDYHRDPCRSPRAAFQPRGHRFHLLANARRGGSDGPPPGDRAGQGAGRRLPLG